jgi:hypothetical protein
MAVPWGLARQGLVLLLAVGPACFDLKLSTHQHHTLGSLNLTKPTLNHIFI